MSNVTETCITLNRFSEDTHISNFMKIRSVGGKLFQSDGRTDMTKLTVALRNFANTPKHVQVTIIPFKYQN